MIDITLRENFRLEAELVRLWGRVRRDRISQPDERRKLCLQVPLIQRGSGGRPQLFTRHLMLLNLFFLIPRKENSDKWDMHCFQKG